MTDAQVWLHYHWECTCCLATGEVRAGPETTCNMLERLIEDDHRHISPQCPKLRYSIARLDDEYVYPNSLIGQ